MTAKARWPLIMKKPFYVKTALIMYFVSLAISFVVSIYNYWIIEPNPSFFIVLLSWVSFFGFALFLGFKMGSKKNWARILYTVFSIFSLATYLFVDMESQIVSEIERVFLFLNNFVLVATLILLYMPSSNNWFKSD